MHWNETLDSGVYSDWKLLSRNTCTYRRDYWLKERNARRKETNWIDTQHLLDLNWWKTVRNIPNVALVGWCKFQNLLFFKKGGQSKNRYRESILFFGLLYFFAAIVFKGNIEMKSSNRLYQSPRFLWNITHLNTSYKNKNTLIRYKWFVYSMWKEVFSKILYPGI